MVRACITGFSAGRKRRATAPCKTEADPAGTALTHKLPAGRQRGSGAVRVFHIDMRALCEPAPLLQRRGLLVSALPLGGAALAARAVAADAVPSAAATGAPAQPAATAQAAKEAAEA